MTIQLNQLDIMLALLLVLNYRIAGKFGEVFNLAKFAAKLKTVKHCVMRMRSVSVVAKLANMFRRRIRQVQCSPHFPAIRYNKFKTMDLVKTHPFSNVYNKHDHDYKPGKCYKGNGSIG